MLQDPVPRKRVVLIGECLVELNGAMSGNLRLAFGGDSLNTALYLARLTRSTISVQYVTVMGTDALTDAMIASWRTEGIDTSLVLSDSSRLPGLYLIQVAEDGERSFLYWRAESAARYLLRHSAFDRVAAELAEADLIYVSGISLAILPAEDRTRMLDLLVRLANRGIPIALDSNYRASLWASADLARSALTTLMPATRLMFATFDDEKCLWGDDTPEMTRVRLHAAKVPIVAIKLGAAGCLYSDGMAAIKVPAAPIATIIDTTAAGDAFNAGFLAGWLADRTPEECCRAGNTLAGTVIQHHGAIIPAAATPSLSELFP
jgi:2-dehydro-3-deoxygluconokinase